MLPHNRGTKEIKHKSDQHALAVALAMKTAIASGAAGVVAIAAWLNENDVPTSRGGIWRGESVRRTLNRIADLDDTASQVRSRSENQYARYEARRIRIAAAAAAVKL